MSIRTRSQHLAQKAFSCVESRKERDDFGEYETVARKFPALIHVCGLVQAVAFAQAKRKLDKQGSEGGPEYQYLTDLANVLKEGGHNEIMSADSLAIHCRTDFLADYLRLSRDAIDAAVWLKRYAEALSEGAPTKQEAKS